MSPVRGGTFTNRGECLPRKGKPVPGREQRSRVLGNVPEPWGNVPEAWGSVPELRGNVPELGGTFQGSGETFPFSGGTFPFVNLSVGPVLDELHQIPQRIGLAAEGSQR